MSAHLLILLENEAYPFDARVRYEAEALLAAGYGVTVAGPTQEGFEALEEDVRGVRVLRYPAPPQGGGAAGYLREYGTAAARLRGLVRRVARERRVDAVIACNPPDFLSQLARPLPRRGTAVIFDHHDLSPELFVRKFGRRGVLHRLLLAVEAAAFRHADVVLASNESYAEIARQRGGVSPERLFVVRTAPDPGRIYPVDPRPDLREGFEHMVLWTGNLTQPERVARLIEAADELVKRRGREDVLFALVGRGHAQAVVQQDVARRGLERFVRLPGHAGDELLREYLATADLCVSVDEPNEMNNLSTVTKVLDYMAAGCAVVQFPLAEMRRASGEATEYAAVGDVGHLADRIEGLLDEPVRRERLGAMARERMLEGRMWPDQVPSLLAAVEVALARASQRVPQPA